MPHSVLPELRSCGGRVSAESNSSGWDRLVRSFLVALEPVGMNGDGVAGILGDGVAGILGDGWEC